MALRRWFLNLAAFAAAATAVVLALYSWQSGAQLPAAAATRSYAGNVPAPAFPKGLDWINTNGKELSLDQLRGKVVLLDFWTYGCINCMHVIPDLHRLQEKYGEALVVIGVHSAKFENERKTENIRKIAQRYGRDEPIVNDRAFAVWNAYGARAWPTLVLIDPEGRAIGQVAGEGHYDLLDEIIGGAIEQFGAAGKLDREPLPYIGGLDMPDTALLFPGKVLADAAGKRLFIADSNHNRIVVTDLDGTVKVVIGNGAAGLLDGDFASAQFNGPQGLALANNDTLYVADTLNNAIRRVDLDRQRVTTIAGTGKQVYMRDDEYAADGTPLNSPWDVLWHDDTLYIAMAGQHQLWTYSPGQNRLRAFAGSRREELRDGPRLHAGLNQPSGLALHDGILYVADSEASAIRAVTPGDNGAVKTLVGTGLFDFGDVDGVGRAVRLQHPLGVAWYDDALFVADTYNSKIKKLDPRERVSITYYGGDGKLDEPGGLSVAGDILYIADTNHHAVKTINLKTGAERALVLSDPHKLLARAQ